MEPIRKSITAGGVLYTFKLPTARDLVQMDIAAARMREGVPVEEMPMGASYSRTICMLRQFCVEPKNVDFEDMYGHELDELGSEVTAWVNSFRAPVGGDASSAGTGSGA